MARMGELPPPVDGEVAANGHAPALVPFTVPPALQARQGGAVSPWPQPDWPDRWRPAIRRAVAHRGWLAAIPVVLVNAVAFGAQLGFWRVHVPLLAEAVLVALALESIAIYLAWQAHLAQLADDSALRLRLAAYGMALVIGALNYSHFALPGWRPDVAAVTFGMMSAISPWLWSVHSRRASRDALKARGLIEPHAVRLGTTRWAWHPLRSARVMFRATWRGENDPAKALALPAITATESETADMPDGDSDSDTGDLDQRRDGDSDRDKDDGDERQGPDPDSDKSDDTGDSRQRQRGTSASDKVRDILKRHPALRKRLLEGDVATRKAAKTDVAQRAGVSVRTVERVISEDATAESRG
jgi:hypothetical protein